MTDKVKTQLLLTERALTDLSGVFKYSVEQWGHQAAETYLNDLEAGLERLQQQPDLLLPLAEFHPAFRFYRVNKHLFACDYEPGSIIVLTVIHASMDIPNRLAELQPSLVTEVELLHSKLRQSKHS